VCESSFFFSCSIYGTKFTALMAAFLSEGSKFLFFDTSVCRNTVWFPSGADSLPRVAESCELGPTGYYSIAGGAIFFLCLIIVCLKAPEMRKLNSDYGTDFDRGDSDVESAMDRRHYGPSEVSYGESADRYDMEGSEEENQSRGSPAIDRTGTGRTANEDEQEVSYNKDSAFFTAPKKGVQDNSSSEGSGDGRDQSSQHKRQVSADCRDGADDLMKSRMKTLDSAEDRCTSNPKDNHEKEKADDRYDPTKPKPQPLTPLKDQRISESRVNTIEKMELNTSADADDMIEKFVTDLNLSYQVETEDEAKKKETDAIEPPGTCETPNIIQTLCAPSSTRSF
jgi:hypothetical protein